MFKQPTEKQEKRKREMRNRGKQKANDKTVYLTLNVVMITISISGIITTQKEKISRKGI